MTAVLAPATERAKPTGGEWWAEPKAYGWVVLTSARDGPIATCMGSNAEANARFIAHALTTFGLLKEVLADSDKDGHHGICDGDAECPIVRGRVHVAEVEGT